MFDFPWDLDEKYSPEDTFYEGFDPCAESPDYLACREKLLRAEEDWYEDEWEEEEPEGEWDYWDDQDEWEEEY